MHPSAKPLLIFYADDDADDRELFSEILDMVDDNHQLHLHNDGEELIQALRHPPHPNLIFLDLNMPRKNGYQALKEMRASDSHQQTPVIIFTTSGDTQSITAARELGANMFISKPRSYTQFKQTLEEVLALDWRNPSASNQRFESRIN